MEVIYYFDSRGNPFRATKLKERKDGSLDLAYINGRRQMVSVEKVVPKKKAKIWEFEEVMRDGKLVQEPRGFAINCYKIVQRSDPKVEEDE